MNCPRCEKIDLERRFWRRLFRDTSLSMAPDCGLGVLDLQNLVWLIEGPTEEEMHKVVDAHPAYVIGLSEQWNEEAMNQDFLIPPRSDLLARIECCEKRKEAEDVQVDKSDAVVDIAEDLFECYYCKEKKPQEFMDKRTVRGIAPCCAECRANGKDIFLCSRCNKHQKRVCFAPSKLLEDDRICGMCESLAGTLR